MFVDAREMVSGPCPVSAQCLRGSEAYPLGYVEDFFETRTKVEAFFSILSNERR